MSRDTRDAALRRLLVAQATRDPQRMPWPAIVGTVAVVALLGGVAIGATTVPRGGGDLPSGDPVISEVGPPSFILDDAEVLATPMVISFTETVGFEAGPPPARATALAVAVYCEEPGTYDLELDGVWVGGGSCDGGSGGSGGYWDYDPAGPNVVMATPMGGRFTIWIAWVARPLDPEPSAEQTVALADGIVTRDEYLAAYDRFVGCLAVDGYQVYGDRDMEVISYSTEADAGESGALDRCYIAEFQLVDAHWQVSLEE